MRRKIVQGKWVLLSAITLIFAACGQKEINLSDKVPNQAMVVGKINSESFVQEHFFDLLKEVDLFGSGSEQMMSPADIGIKSLSNYYFFVTGTDIRNIQINFLCQLGDKDKLTSYLKEHEARLEEGEKSFAFLDMTTALVFDEQTCLVVKTFGLPVVKEACLRTFDADYSDDVREESLSKSLESVAHFSLWVNNKETIKLYTAIQGLLHSLGQITFQVPITQTSEYSSIDFKFEQGQVLVDYSQYYTDEQFSQFSKFKLEESASDLARFSLSENPAFWLSLSIQPQELRTVISGTPSIESKINQLLGGFISIEEISKAIDGRCFLSFQGFDTKKKKEFVTILDSKTGEYNAVQKEVGSDVPMLGIALGIKDKTFLEERFSFALKNLPVENGVYNVNNEYFFKLTDSLLLIGTGDLGKQMLNGKLVDKSRFETQIGKGLASYQLNLADLLGGLPKDEKLGESIEDILVGVLKELHTGPYFEEQNRVNQSFVLTLQKQDNSLLQLGRMFADLKSALHL